MSAYTSTIQKMYVAFFNRPADFNGLLNWEAFAAGKTEAALVSQIAKEFSKAAEYTIVYKGMEPSQIVTKIYNNLLNRDPDMAGLTNWVNHLAKGTSTVDSLVTDILTVAGADDLKTINNKVTAATAFTSALDTVAEANAYSGAAANAVAAQWLAAVGTDASLAAATTPAALTAVTANVLSNSGNAVGTTFTLTTGMDNLTGTTLNDNFRAVIDSDTDNKNVTLSATDSLDGGAGVDTLDIIGNGAAANSVTPLFLKNVEKVSVKDVHAAASTTVNLVNATGVTEVINNGSVGAVRFENIGKGAAVTVQNVATGVGTTFTRGTSAVTDALTINLNTLGTVAAPGVTAVASGAVASDDTNNQATNVTINATGPVSVASMNVTGTSTDTTHKASTVTVQASGATNLGSGITGFDTTKAGTLYVGGTGSVNLGTLAGAVKTVDASNSTGGVTVVGGQYTGSDATASAAPGLKVIGSAGNDTVTFNAVASADVALGAGNDTAIVASTLASGVKIAGGEGTDTLVLTQAAITSLNGTTTAINTLRSGITGFEQLAISDKLATTFNVNTVGAYNYLQVQGDVGDTAATLSAITVDGFVDNATVEFRGAASTGTTGTGAFAQEDILNIGMTGAALNTNATLNLKLNANLVAASTTWGAGATVLGGTQATYKAAVDGINIINITANDRVNNVVDDNQVAAADRDNGANVGYAIELTSAANLRTVKIDGTSLVSYTVANGTNALQTIDASASTGNTVLNAGNFAGTERVTIKGSQGENVITGSNTTFGDAIIGGAKNDSITGGQGADDITGGGGRDIFVFASGDSTATSTSVTGIDKIADFGKVTVAGTAATNTAFQTTGSAGGANADLLDLAGTPTLATAAAITGFSSTQLGTIGGATGSDVINTHDIKFAVNSKGLITLSGADAAKVDSLVEWVAVADILTGTTAGVTATFEFGGNTYVFQEGTADILVQLTGVTGFAATNGLVLAGTAATVGDIFIG